VAGATGTSILELRTGGPGSRALDITAFVRKFVWYESLIAGGWSWELAFAAEQWPEWEPLLLGRDEPEVGRYFRLGAQSSGRDDPGITTDWRFAVVDGSSSAIKGTALLGHVTGGDRRLLLASKARTRAWPASTVAGILRQIAAEYGISSTIENTLGTRDRLQVRESDWTFIMRLGREAASASGRGDVFPFMDEERLLFGAPNLVAPSERRHDLAEVENRVENTIVAYNGRTADRRGAGTLRGVGYDLDQQAPIVFEVDGQAAQTHPSLARRVPRPQEDALRVLPVMEESAALVEAQARSAWGRAAPRYFSLRLDTRPDLTLRPGKVVEVQATLDGRRDSPLFGRFVVLEVKHTMDGANLTTTIACFRREAFQGEEDPTGASASSGGTRDRYRFGGDDRPRTVIRAEVIDAR
jgi:phage protein D